MGRFLTILGLAVMVGLLLTGCGPRPTPTPRVELSQVELHYWVVCKAAQAENEAALRAHLEKLLELVSDPGQRSELDGLLREHLPEKHFVHIRKTVKELLGDKPEPELTLEQIQARLGFPR